MPAGRQRYIMATLDARQTPQVDSSEVFTSANLARTNVGKWVEVKQR